MKIHASTKKITYQGLDAFLPVLIEQDIDSKTDRTIKRVHISTEEPLSNKQTALKYANIWRNEWLANA